MQEASGVVEGSSMLDGEALKRADAALELIKLPPEGFDPVEGRQKLDAMLAHSV
jgi:beta-N-acetylhexosaminidase